MALILTDPTVLAKYRKNLGYFFEILYNISGSSMRIVLFIQEENIPQNLCRFPLIKLNGQKVLFIVLIDV